MTEPGPQVAEFILCEDIREELHGRVSLMGLYRDQVTFLDDGSEVWPRALKHAVFVRINHLPPGSVQLTLTVESETGTLFEHKGVFQQDPVAPKSEVNLNANLGLSVPGYGRLITRIILESESGEKLLERERPLMIVPETALRTSAPTGSTG